MCCRPYSLYQARRAITTLCQSRHGLEHSVSTSRLVATAAPVPAASPLTPCPTHASVRTTTCVLPYSQVDYHHKSEEHPKDLGRDSW